MHGKRATLKLAEEILRLPPASPARPSPEPVEGKTCLAAWPSVILFTRGTRSESMPLGLPAATLTLICLGRCSGIQRGRGRATQWWHHTSHLRPPGLKASIQWQPERASVSRAAITFERLPRRTCEMQCVIRRKSRQMRYKPKSITGRRLNFLMLDSAFFALFPPPTLIYPFQFSFFSVLLQPLASAALVTL